MKVLEPEEEVEQVMRKHQQLVLASDSDSSAAVLQLGAPQRTAATMSGHMLRHEVYPPSCILPDISQVISQTMPPLQTCSSKASCGSIGAGHAGAHAWQVCSGTTAIGSDGRMQSTATRRDHHVRTDGHVHLSSACAVSSSDAAMPSSNLLKAGHYMPCSSAHAPGSFQNARTSGRNQSPDGSRETNSCAAQKSAAQCSGGGMSSLQSRSEEGHGTHSAFEKDSLIRKRGNNRSRTHAQLPCQSSTREAAQMVDMPSTDDASPRPRKLLATVQLATDASAMDCM